ncbi:mediator of RNA polymerase II transcription subunit 10b-like [Phoenix dactylifera]|uniref:Mediator of RNA polymerase II transcription subunit 10 n=1 Tax=Phoenix dactylifera TaxID=42345 RepID=A0A8B7BYP0_PHODC|nr:mediator of RNA polymerase II transcription subunit 10b-like [Phoenix dactylifera]
MNPSPNSTAGNGGLSAITGATMAAGNALTSTTNAYSSAAAVAAADPAADSSQNLKQVIHSVDKTLGLLHQLYLTVSSFSVVSQLPLLQRLNALVADLDTMQKLAENCDIQVPMEVVNLIDDGKNPDEFTRDVLNNCIAKNQSTKGKTDAFKSLRKYLLEELEQAFPDEVENYREIRASSAAESKRMAQSQSVLPNGDVKVKTEH